MQPPSSSLHSSTTSSLNHPLPPENNLIPPENHSSFSKNLPSISSHTNINHLLLLHFENQKKLADFQAKQLADQQQQFVTLLSAILPANYSQTPPVDVVSAQSALIPSLSTQFSEFSGSSAPASTSLVVSAEVNGRFEGSKTVPNSSFMGNTAVSSPSTLTNLSQLPRASEVQSVHHSAENPISA